MFKHIKENQITGRFFVFRFLLSKQKKKKGGFWISHFKTKIHWPQSTRTDREQKYRIHFNCTFSNTLSSFSNFLCAFHDPNEFITSNIDDTHNSVLGSILNRHVQFVKLQLLFYVLLCMHVLCVQMFREKGDVCACIFAFR